MLCIVVDWKKNKSTIANALDLLIASVSDQDESVLVQQKKNIIYVACYCLQYNIRLDLINNLKHETAT